MLLNIPKHPQIIDRNENLTIVENEFGKCIAGTHPVIRGVSGTVRRVLINHVIGESIKDFIKYVQI